MDIPFLVRLGYAMCVTNDVKKRFEIQARELFRMFKYIEKGEVSAETHRYKNAIIGIPVKAVSCDSENCVVELPYTPLANKDVFEKEVEVTSEHPYGDKVHIAIIYKDVYENLYEMKITFIQHSKFDMSETEVLSDGLLANECTK